MFIKKKPQWNIFCKIKKDPLDKKEKGVQLSFTTYDFLNFVPPNGNVSDFNLCAELGLNYPNLKPGIYTDPSACCIITKKSNGIYLNGASNDWQKLNVLIAKIISSASMEPKIVHEENASLQQIIAEWTEAILFLSKS